MKNSSQLGFWGLTGIVFGMMVGAGIYNIPQNMATPPSDPPRHERFFEGKGCFFGKFH